MNSPNPRAQIVLSEESKEELAQAYLLRDNQGPTPSSIAVPTPKNKQRSTITPHFQTNVWVDTEKRDTLQLEPESNDWISLHSQPFSQNLEIETLRMAPESVHVSKATRDHNPHYFTTTLPESDKFYFVQSLQGDPTQSIDIQDTPYQDRFNHLAESNESVLNQERNELEAKYRQVKSNDKEIP